MLEDAVAEHQVKRFVRAGQSLHVALDHQLWLLQERSRQFDKPGIDLDTYCVVAETTELLERLGPMATANHQNASAVAEIEQPSEARETQLKQLRLTRAILEDPEVSRQRQAPEIGVQLCELAVAI
jgi:hypothetical protein